MKQRGHIHDIVNRNRYGSSGSLANQDGRTDNSPLETTSRTILVRLEIRRPSRAATQEDEEELRKDPSDKGANLRRQGGERVAVWCGAVGIPE
jgi:hypothetical protein